MPPESAEQIIERNIKVYLEAAGCEDVARGVKAVQKEILALRKASKATGETMGDLNDEMIAQSKAYVKNEKAAVKSLKKQREEISKTIKKWSGFGGALSGTFGEITQGLSKIAGFGSFGRMVNRAISYDKALLSLSASTTRLGIGTSTLDNKIKDMSRSLNLTKMDTLALLESFESGFKTSSFDNVETLLTRIKGMVGSNAEAMEKYKNVIGGLSQENFGLADAISKLDKDSTEEQKKALELRVQTLYIRNKLSEAEFRGISAVIRGQKSFNDEDEKALQQKKAHIDAMEKFNRQMETVQMALGNTILPFLEKVATWLDRITEGGEKWGRGVAATVALLAGVKIGGALMVKGATSLAMGAMGAGGAGSAGLGAAAAGSTAALSGVSAALLQFAAVIGTAIVAWKAGTAVYNTMVDPWMEEKYDKVSRDEDSLTHKFLLWLGGGAEEDPNAEKAAIARKKSAPRIAKKREEAAEAEKKIADEKQRQLDLESELAKKEQERLLYSQQAGVFAGKLKELKAAESELLTAQIERMKLTGQVDEGVLMKGKDKAFAAIDAEVRATKSYVASLKERQQLEQQGADFSGKTVDEMAKRFGWAKHIVENLKAQGIEYAEQIDMQADISRGEATIQQKTKERQAIVEAINQAYQAQIAYQGTLVDKAGLLVQIADSYAMGVGASARMRMTEFNAIENQRRELEKQYQIQKAQLAGMAEGDARLKQAQTVQETENQILQLQLKQAGITKSLRDGWIEAIGSMNTGAGTFSKIVMDQNRGAAQSLKLAGQFAVTSSRSGSTRGGYRTSEKFSSMQGAAGQGLLTNQMGGRRAEAYRTTMDDITGASAEGLQWKSRQAAQRELARRNRFAASGGLAGTAFGGSKHYEGVVGEQGADVMGPTAPDWTKPRSVTDTVGAAAVAEPTTSKASNAINVNVTLRGNASEVAKEIANKIGPEVANIVHQSVSEFGDSVGLR